MTDRKPAYDPAKRNKAVNMATLRAVVAAYLLYLGVSILWDYLRGSSTLSALVAWSSGLGFSVAAIAFGFFTWKHLRAGLEAAQLSEASDGESSEEE